MTENDADLDKQRYRILVTGPPGTGKTTLVGALATMLQLPVVPEAALELGGLGLTINEDGGGSELAAIAIHQYHLERAAGAGAFVADRGAVDVLAYARALAQRRAATALDRRLANSVCGFAESWLAERPYDLIVSCQHRFISRRMSDAALTCLEGEQRAVLAEVDARIVRLTSAADYGDFLDSVLTVARSDRQ